MDLLNSEVIKVSRQFAGLSQKNFAESLGISQTLLWFYEHGRRKPTAEIKAKILQVLKSYDVDNNKLLIIAGLVGDKNGQGKY